MLIPFVIFLVLSGFSIKALGWFAIIPIWIMLTILAFISDAYFENTKDGK